MVNTVKNTTNNAATIFAGANGAKNPVAAAAMVAFINANGGIANLALQLNPVALNKGVLFGGGRLWHAMQPNAKTGKISARGLILWACVNGVPQGAGKGNFAQKVVTKVPAKLGTVPLQQIQLAHNFYGAGITHNTSVPAGGPANQNALLAILNGGFGLSNQTLATYGNAYGQLVPLA